MTTLDPYPLAVLALGAMAAGILLLVKGGDLTIDGAVWTAKKSGLSKLFIAATIVAFGTSAPELFTSVNANMSGFPGVSIGNVVGSNIANILMVLGVAAIITPVLVKREEVLIDTLVMMAATVALGVGMIAGIFSPLAGFAMLAFLVAYVAYQYRSNTIDTDDVDDDIVGRFSGKYPAFVALFAGIGLLVVGSELLVQGAIAGGLALGVPEVIIGMTVVAFGTSVPELMTCIAAARKKQSEMIVGGIVGSNIFNILSIVSITAIIKPLDVAGSVGLTETLMVLASTGVLSVFLLMGLSIGRLTGSIFLIAYALFVFFQYAS